MSLIHLIFFCHLIKSILAEEVDTKEEVEIEVGTTIMEVDIEADMMEDMDVVGMADEVAVDTADMEIIVVGHTAEITGLDLNNQQTTKLYSFSLAQITMQNLSKSVICAMHN